MKEKEEKFKIIKIHREFFPLFFEKHKGNREGNKKIKNRL